MAKHSNNMELFLPGGCLSVQAIDRYLTSGLSSEEREAVEKHISECEFCTEAVEGYRRTELKDSIYATIKKLNRKIEFRKHTAHDRILSINKKIIAYSSLAASILILAGLFLLINYLNIEQRNILTEKQQKEEAKGTPAEASEEAESPVPELTSDSFSNVVDIKETTAGEKEIMPVSSRAPALSEKIYTAENANKMKPVAASEKIEVLSEPLAVAEIPGTENRNKIEKTESEDIGMIEDKADYEAESMKSAGFRTARSKGRVKYAKKDELTGGHVEQPSPPSPSENIEVIAIVENNAELDTKFEMNDTDGDQYLEMNFMPFEEEEAGEEEVFIIVEDMPKFKEGDIDTFRIWVQQNLRYPEDAIENEISGKVFVQFVVDEKGKVVNVKVVRGVDPALDDEALRVIKSSPDWEPGKQRGNAVKVQFTFPVVFTLQ